MFTTLLGCDDAVLQYMQSEEFIGFTAILLGCLTGIVAIVATMTAGVLKTRARELTKRELAAYVAEGSLDPDKAVAMINAGRPKWEVADGNKMVRET
jgi:hypothetical protein